MEFILAGKEHLNDLCRISEQAKAQLKGMGVNQWQKGYPSQADWEEDIKNKTAWVAVEKGRVLGVFMLMTTPEESYDEIEGGWLADIPYASLHRVCVADECKGTGVAGALFERSFEMARQMGFRSMRIDTHPDNTSMLRALEKSGFVRCGTIILKGGSEMGDIRIAFEKLL